MCMKVPPRILNSKISLYTPINTYKVTIITKGTVVGNRILNIEEACNQHHQPTRQSGKSNAMQMTNRTYSARAKM